MQISELSDRSGLTVQTIKFYIREGLLPKGSAVSATRAEYDGRHLERLRLISALREVGDLPVAAIQQIIEAVEDDRAGLHDLVATAQHAIGPHATAPHDPHWRAAREDVDALVRELGWTVGEHAPARDLLAHTFVALRRLGFPITLKDLRPYVSAAREISEHEAGRVTEGTPRARTVHTLIVSTVLYEQVFTALHRLALEDASARRFGRP
ncbi:MULTISPECIES: MerR family transcriptional regulator [Actinomadura]|uniref:MerR HTH family regulatory protein n=1 Tax=Actinomadura madurae TaxID=1993 RepID=A0A1I4VZ27_9ACTN|nr:MerR family transcriptional regulator [Actinomadura madurae]MCP9954344.1 MerR family transcriptional regulator [Actinomadura madurae]MCP9971097.1 MerR family transcriptional regulator [Actinomadura madurae]MCP9983577.1 MerR family transcriptional regulator [Actinomadura madurae]MCQ0004854.1 MerR family transcriptional regulator [Actinomadura madurae]MCQ0019809.1 MerR family transcriptional regulator [Actinomadura madurae]